MKAQLKTELNRARRAGLLQAVREAAQARGVPVTLLLAIGSRESLLGGALAPDCTGDGGEALTVFQIDRRFHPGWAARHDPCDHPAGARKAADLLRGHYDTLGTWARAAAAYNAGRESVRGAVRAGRELDTVTTGNYVADVQRRRRIFEELIPAQAGFPGGGLLLAGGGVAATLYFLTN